MEITAQMVKELRQATSAGVLDAKKALVAADGDFEKAAQALREKGLAKAAKKAGREAKEGLVEMYAHQGNRVGVMLELSCETDFVARNDAFRQLAHDLALQVAAMSPTYVKVEDVPADIIAKEREFHANKALADGKPEKIIDRIVDGQINKYYEENCLLEQAFVKDDKVKIGTLVTNAVATLGENIFVRRFTRYELGEAL